MDSLPTRAVWGVVVPCVLLSPVIAFLLAIAIEIVVSSLVDAGAPAFLALIIAGAGGLLLFRKLRPQSGSVSRDLSSRAELRENRGRNGLGVLG